MPFPPCPVHRRLLSLVLAAALLAAGGCKSLGWGDEDEVPQGSPEQIYREAREKIQDGNYPAAIERYELLEARYPFSEQAKQGQLDLLYAYYKNHAGESAIDQADQFSAKPDHPRVDYAHYLKGLLYFEGGANWLERLFRADISSGRRKRHASRSRNSRRWCSSIRRAPTPPTPGGA